MKINQYAHGRYRVCVVKITYFRNRGLESWYGWYTFREWYMENAEMGSILSSFMGRGCAVVNKLKVKTRNIQRTKNF
jgi:hypothetical protein